MKREDLQIWVCETCGGTGLVSDAKCSVCNGVGNASVINQSTQTFAFRLDGFGFGLRRLERSVNKWINLITYGFSVLAAIGFIVYLVMIGPENFFTLSFIRQPSLPVTLFYFAILGGCYVAYRGYRMSDRVRPVKFPSFGKELELGIYDPASKKSALDIAPTFNNEAFEVLESAYSLAKTYQNGQVSPAHIVSACFTTDSVGIVSWRMGLAADKLSGALRAMLEKMRGTEATSIFGKEIYEVMHRAELEAIIERRRFVGAVELLLAAYDSSKEAQAMLFDLGVDRERLENTVQWVRMNETLRNWTKRFMQAAAEKPTGAMNRAMTSRATPVLDRFSEDFTMLATFGRLPMLVGREREMEEILRIMEAGRQSVVLVGGPGVGKDAIVAGLAARMVLEEVPEILHDKRLVALSITKLVAGRPADEAEGALMAALREAENSQNIILVVPDAHLMSGSGASGSVDLMAAFGAELERSGLIAILTTTPEAYNHSIEKGPLASITQKVVVTEMDVNSAIRVLEAKVGAFENEFGTPFLYEAVEAAVKLTDRYDHEEPLPQKAVAVAREAALAVSKKKGKGTPVTAEDIAAIVSAKSNVKVTSVQGGEAEKLLGLEEQIGKRVIGQREAIKAVSTALRRARTELRSGKRPIGSFLFLGPTGVGKTELSKAVAATFFGSEKNMIRLDMSEYQDPTSVQRLLGVPGTGNGGVLTEAVRKEPYSLVLFDELEKAHKDILNLFLQVMDDGRLTDVTGRTVDFTNTIIIMTSNAGTQYIQDEVKKGTPVPEIRKLLMENELRNSYRPEFLNRFDEVIVFLPLTLEDATKIAELMILDLGNRLEQKGVYFETTQEALAAFALKGFDPLFGARPMRRLVQDSLENQIAELMLRGELKRGDVAVLALDGVIRVEKKG